MPIYSKHAAYLPRNHPWVTYHQLGKIFIGILLIPLNRSIVHVRMRCPNTFLYTFIYILSYSFVISVAQTFKRNVNRVRAIISGLVDAKNFWQSLIDWDYPSKSIMAFIVS